MKFINDDFILSNKIAKRLFHDVAKSLPIIDYHNHLDARAIADSAPIESLAKLMVCSDPYKHRAMRIAGIPEREISGNASDEEKFLAWAKVCSKTWGNPLFHWSAIEFKRVFGIDDVLEESNALEIMSRCNALIKEKGIDTNSLLRFWNVETLCTSDDLLDDVSVHAQASKEAKTFSVRPSLRGDSILAFQTPQFSAWFEKLNVNEKTLDAFLCAVRKRIDAFDSVGCKLSDHSLDSGFRYERTEEAEASKIFSKALGCKATTYEIVKLKSYVLRVLAKEYSKRGWIMQLHIGAERFTSSRLRKLAGAVGGYATIGTSCDITSLVRFIDDIEKEDALGKIILYTLNPADNQAFATLTGSFSQDGIWGKIQFGPAWWYNDHYEGILSNFKAISSFGLFSKFIGMTTDSRSLLSFSRHEYFRRILCSYIGEMAERGEIPNDWDILSSAVADISYNNAKNWIF